MRCTIHSLVSCNPANKGHLALGDRSGADGIGVVG